MDAKIRVKHAEIDLFVEQSEKYEVSDGMNDYLKEHCASDPPLEDHSLQPDVNSATPISKSHPVESHGAISTPFVTPTSDQPQLPLLSTPETVKPRPIITLSSTPCVAAVANSKTCMFR